MIFIYLILFVQTKISSPITEQEFNLLSNKNGWRLVYDKCGEHTEKPSGYNGGVFTKESTGVIHFQVDVVNDERKKEWYSKDGIDVNINDTAFYTDISLSGPTSFATHEVLVPKQKNHNTGKLMVDTKNRMLGFRHWQKTHIKPTKANDYKTHWFKIIEINEEFLILESKTESFKKTVKFFRNPR
jgi:hypothetical protein